MMNLGVLAQNRDALLLAEVAAQLCRRWRMTTDEKTVQRYVLLGAEIC